MLQPILVIFAICLSSRLIMAQVEFTDAKRFKKAVSTFQLNLMGMLKTTGYDAIQKEYNNTINAHNVTSRLLNGSEIVQDMADQISKSFANQVAALKTLKYEAEKAVKAYKYNSNLRISDVKYVNMKDINKSNISLEYHPKFRQEINLNTSGIHIPLDVYEGYPQVLQGIQWSEDLDEVFKQNFRNNAQLSWQFFGSATGFMKIYPVNKWKNNKKSVDLFDVRRRTWYIHGTTSSKDMLILMDTSGSVHGQTFAIMKQAVKILLNTLDANDYVNVAWFNNKVGWITSFQTFVQANSWHKKLFYYAIDELKANGIADYSRALEFAFKAFKKFGATKLDYEGAECHQVIMIFTDGGTERPEEVLKKWNNNKKIRIFTNIVGVHASAVNVVKRMACDNKGYFDNIHSISAIQSKIQKYPNVLGRPMALNNSQSETYSTVYTDAGGLGMVITVTLPVYNQTDSRNNQWSVGVVGIDTPVADIEATMPRYKTGPNSYSFAINRNGFAIMHPKMKPHINDLLPKIYDQKVYLANVPDVDFLHLESSDFQTRFEDYEDVRKNMIDEETGSKQIINYIDSGDHLHIVQKNIAYYFTPIKHTSISLGIVIPDERKGYLSFNKSNKIQKLDIDTETKGILFAPWDFCPGLKTNIDMPTFVKELQEALSKNHNSCNQEMVNRLAMDLKATKLLQKMSTKPICTDNNCNWSAVFVGTEGGLTRFYPKSDELYMMKIRDPFRSIYYKKALYYPNWTFTISDEFGQNQSLSFVTAIKPITVKVRGITHKPAVFGVRLYEWALVNLLTAFVKNIQKDESNEISETLSSYLLDDGGYIIASNLENSGRKMGNFLGEVDPALMKELINRPVYLKRHACNYNAICYHEQPRKSVASKSNRIPSLMSIFQVVMHMVADTVIWILTTGWSSLRLTDATREPKMSFQHSSYPCTKLRTLYHFMDSADVPITCGNCSRNYAATRLLKTNLLLVVAIQPNESLDANSRNEWEKFSQTEEGKLCRVQCNTFTAIAIIVACGCNLYECFRCEDKLKKRS